MNDRELEILEQHSIDMGPYMAARSEAVKDFLRAGSILLNVVDEVETMAIEARERGWHIHPEEILQKLGKT